MFISDRLVFLELQKTGCTHIRDALVHLVGGQLVGKHNQVEDALLRRAPAFLGSVRDPWDWYLSLWTYGCAGKGAIQRRVTTPGLRLHGLGWAQHPVAAWVGLRSRWRRDVQAWQAVYRDPADPQAFRQWLRLLLQPPTHYDIGEGFGASPLSLAAGLMTYRFVRLFTLSRSQLRLMNGLTSQAKIAQHIERHCFVQQFIRMEHLESDLIAALAACGLPLDAGQQAELLARRPTNTSQRPLGLSHYYDAESSALVAAREAVLIERFNYRAPGTTPA